MGNILRPLAGVSVIAALFGCSVESGEAERIEGRLSDLERRAAVLESQTSSLDTKLTAFIQLDGDRKAYLDPSGNGGYGAVQTDVGILLVSVSRVSPKADGTELVLEIGNPSSATYVGAEAQIDYNVRYETSANWKEGLRSTKSKIVRPLLPATWNTVTTSLPGIRPDQLGYLAVNVVPDEVRLNKPIE